MARAPKPISWAPLQADEVERLPPRVRARLAVGPGRETEGEWVVLHATGVSVAGVVDRLSRLYGMRAGARTKASSVEDLDRVLEWLVSAGSGAQAQLAVDNLEMRREYLDETPTLTAADIHMASGLQSRNTSEPASRWKGEGKLFAVRVGRRDLYPVFQFEDGAPRSVIKDILGALPETMTGWQKALWFASGNGWLDGDEPQRRLDDRQQVVEAASRLAEPASG